MRRTAAVLGIVVLTGLAACARSGEAAKDCGVDGPPRLLEYGVGALRVGATVQEVKQRCQVLLDTAMPLGNEGMPERRMTVVVGSVPLVATVSDGRVWRVEIVSPRLRTADSLGVGSRMRDLRSTTARLSAGEHGAYVVRSDHCGLSFQLPGVVGAPNMSATEIPDTATVGMVLVVGCGEAPLDSSALVALGDSVFHGRVAGELCATCHGSAGRGSSVAPDLTDGTWLHGDGSEDFIARVVRTGLPMPRRFGHGMPASTHLSDAYVHAVASYVRSISR